MSSDAISFLLFSPPFFFFPEFFWVGLLLNNGLERAGGSTGCAVCPLTFGPGCGRCAVVRRGWGTAPSPLPGKVHIARLHRHTVSKNSFSFACLRLPQHGWWWKQVQSDSAKNSDLNNCSYMRWGYFSSPPPRRLACLADPGSYS